jgi:hypothetical protein
MKILFLISWFLDFLIFELLDFFNTFNAVHLGTESKESVPIELYLYEYMMTP